MLVRLSSDGEFYVDEDGGQYHRVSRVLRDVGLQRSSFIRGTHGRDRGRAVHRAIELIHRGTLVESSLDPQIIPFVSAYREFVKTTGFLPIEFEVAFGSIHGFAGTVDAVGWLHGRLVLIDFKTGDSLDPSVEHQTGAYEILWNENRPDQLIEARFALQLKATGKYKLKRMETPAESFLEKYQEFKIAA